MSSISLRPALLARKTALIAPRIYVRSLQSSTSRTLEKKHIWKTHNDVQPAKRRHLSTASTPPPPLASRWLSDLYEGLGSLRDVPGAEERLEKLKGDAVRLMLEAEGFGSEGCYVEKVRWGDMDSMVCHVNNVVYNRFAESSRVSWARTVAEMASLESKKMNPTAQDFGSLTDNKGFGVILQRIDTTYKFPIKYPDTVIVAHKLRQVGESGKFVDLDAIIISQQHQRIAARVSERNFFYSYVEEKAAAAPELVVRAIEKRDENEEWLKERAREEIRELEAWIKEKKN